MNGVQADLSTGFAGLRVSDQTTLLDGSQGGSWWYSVGNTVNHNGGNPGIHPKSSSVSELYVCKQGIIEQIKFQI